MTSKERNWVIGGALGCLAVLALGWFLLISPERSHAATAREATATQQASNDTLRGQIAQLQEQAKGLVAKQADLQAVARRIPSDPQLPVLVRALQDVHTKTGVDITSITFGMPALAAPAGAATSAAGRSGAATFSTIPVTTTVLGDYSNATLFLNALESLQRLYLVKSVAISPSPAKGDKLTLSPDGTAETKHTLTINVVGEVYTTSADVTTAVLPALTGAPAAGAAVSPTPAAPGAGGTGPATSPAPSDFTHTTPTS